MDAATDSIAPGIHAGSLVIYETTLPVGDTRGRYAPRLEAASGLRAEVDGDNGLLLAFSPERLYSGAALRNLATYPKLVGGLGPASRDRAAAFYDSVLDAEIVAMSSAEAAEFSKLADTTYRDVNIALANEFANYADRIGVDLTEVIAAANSQPYSHIHQPGSGSAATASRSTRCSCSTVRPNCRSWLGLAKSTTAKSTWLSRHWGPSWVHSMGSGCSCWG